MVFDADGTLIARAAQFVEELLITDVDIEPVYRKRLLDPRGRVTDRADAHSCSSVRAAGGARRAAPVRMAAQPLAADAELYEALVLGTRRLRAQERLHRCRHRAVGRHRLARSSRASPSTRSAPITCTASHARPLQQRPLQDRRRRPGRASWASTTARSPSSRRSPPTSSMTAPTFAGRPADLTEENLQSRIRGTTLMALSQQVRLDGAHHRQQERDGRRLLHHLRRLGRRLRGHQGRAEDAGVRPVPLRQPARRSRDHQRERHHQATVGRAAARPARRPEPAAVRGARPDPRSCTSRTIAPRRDHRARPRRGASCAASPASSTSTSTSAASARPACGSARRRSARIAACRSPTATAAERTSRAIGRAWRSRCTMRAVRSSLPASPCRCARTAAWQEPKRWRGPACPRRSSGPGPVPASRAPAWLAEGQRADDRELEARHRHDQQHQADARGGRARGRARSRWAPSARRRAAMLRSLPQRSVRRADVTDDSQLAEPERERDRRQRGGREVERVLEPAAEGDEHALAGCHQGQGAGDREPACPADAPLGRRAGSW